MHASIVFIRSVRCVRFNTHAPSQDFDLSLCGQRTAHVPTFFLTGCLCINVHNTKRPGAYCAGSTDSMCKTRIGERRTRTRRRPLGAGCSKLCKERVGRTTKQANRPAYLQLPEVDTRWVVVVFDRSMPYRGAVTITGYCWGLFCCRGLRAVQTKCLCLRLSTTHD